MYIDTHCHIISDYYDDIETSIKEIIKSGIERIIVNGVDRSSNEEIIKLVLKYDIVYGAIGYHPTEEEINDDDISWLEEHINDDKIVALGEIGLDYYHDNTSKEYQINLFKRQLDIASKYNKPVIIHSRDAIMDTYNILSEYKLNGSMHCYGESLEMAYKFIDLGYLIGIGGVCTFRNAKTIINVIENIGLEYIILETDAPYLTPEPYRGLKNSSKYIPVIAKKVSLIKKIDIDIVRDVIYENSMKCFFRENGKFDK